MITRLRTVLMAACAVHVACAREQGGTEAALAHDAEVVAILETADARPVADDSLIPILEGLSSPVATVRMHAVRALGRLERPSMVPVIRPSLDDADAVVRAEAANALAQSVLRSDSSEVRALLDGALERETEADVRGVMAQSLGRLRAPSQHEVRVTAELLTRHLPDAGPVGRLGFAKGFFHLARQRAARGAFPASAATALRGMIGVSSDTALVDRRVRRLASAALALSGAATARDFEAMLADADPHVRRLAATPDAPPERLRRMLTDPAPAVRYDALRVYGTARLPARDCAPVAEAVRDDGAHVALLALDLLAACAPAAVPVAGIDTIAGALPDSAGGAWHAPAHALVALAAVDAGRAASHLAGFVAHPDPFVRMYAARAAAVLRDSAVLRTLVRDSVPNVRSAALRGLGEVAPDPAAAPAIRALEAADGEEVMVAVVQLEGTRDPAAPRALYDALERLTAARRETGRDGRMAILERVEELGSSADTAHLRPLLRDFDPIVAERAAAILTEWTGREVTASPQPLPRSPFPTAETLHALARDTVEIAFASGDTVLVRLHPWDAPTNAARFARLAGERYFDGLTIHRIAPNFVVQGGSPAANEYVGDGPFSRDELNIEGNWRGTMGLSTRGRDTGDGQIYINLVDNIRLDHEYTVFGEVVEGMDVVDGLLEGARITTIRVR